MAVEKVFVVGSGTMGNGITQVAASAGFQVTMCDQLEAQITRAMKTMDWSLAKFIDKGWVKEDKQTVMSRITTTRTLRDAEDADFVIEAVFEDQKIKEEVFRDLDGICREDAILASNTSAIPITALASATGRPSRVVGTHFFAPVPMMKLVEVIRGIHTSDACMDAAMAFCRSLGKDPIRVEKDVAGFIVNRICIPAYLEAVRMLEMGVGSAEDIDKGFRLGMGWKMGPLETMDLSGIEVFLAAAEAVYHETRDDKFAVPCLIRRKVAAGELGRKTGEGFYKYPPSG